MKTHFFTILLLLGFSATGWNAELRDWTRSGVTIRAEFVSQAEGKVTIRKGGRDFQIAIGSLSEADRDWLARETQNVFNKRRKDLGKLRDSRARRGYACDFC